MRHWLIQSTNINTANDERIVEGLNRVGAKFTDFGVIPFSHEITNWQSIPDEPLFLHCSTKVLKIFGDEKIRRSEIFVGSTDEQADALYDRIKDGLFYDVDAFDQTLYLEKLRGSLLNGNSEVMTIRELLPKYFSTDKFIKPGRDLKLFSGGILEGGMTFDQHLDRMTLGSGFEDHLDDRVLIAPYMQIMAEWRFFVVNGNVVTGSQYQKHGELNVDAHVPEHIMGAAKKMARLYTPAEAFVMDLALTRDLELKIVEYNCINCSGVYKADVGKLAWALRKV